MSDHSQKVWIGGTGCGSTLAVDDYLKGAAENNSSVKCLEQDVRSRARLVIVEWFKQRLRRSPSNCPTGAGHRGVAKHE